ncbi:probable protein arginine N-methyltransferase 3 [Hordeum vulgare subsp. vulgare]|uniref:Probable protein arginine N-methyltransferase 3 n=1 Tax=Hordeum vulgare subsp. vulgare TaxID=112509 RepID=A0A8I6WAV7_HORVV|nr:probable protein arginine N-methyltransferase 3 [Hordeum vulgare subsp. vulgare]
MATQARELPPKPELPRDDGDDYEDDEDEEEEGEEGWDDWESDGDDAAGGGGGLLCLFCSAWFDSDTSLFAHCGNEHGFDFHKLVRELGLDFYGCIKLINFVRSKVAENKSWSCAEISQLEGKVPWADDSYLKPFMEDDSLLHSLSIFDDEDDEDCGMPVETGECSAGNGRSGELQGNCLNTIIDDCSDISARFEKAVTTESNGGDNNGSLSEEPTDRQLKITRASVTAKEIKKVDDNYFGSYSSFGIHREMLGDKVRTDAYRDALLDNPSLMNGATVLDVGCGTGILSLFAAKAGASRVIAVDGSAKMSSVATQVAKNNGLLYDENMKMEQKHSSEVITVVHTKAEELNHKIVIPPNGFDVLVSEWMGYCLLYESMLSSVIYARDHFLKPGGAVLPDTATILGAGFGRGGTSLPFWENVYGFDMSSVGKEVTESSARFPVVDILASQDVVTDTAVLHSFDLATMKESEMDFTASLELRLHESGVAVPGVTWCYGIVLWFDTGFTSRFCKDKPVVLSTSPFSTPTHWSQTIFTFEEPIAMVKDGSVVGSSASIGTAECPAVTIRSRISIVRASEHRSIDISIETTGVSSDGRKRSWPAQIFNL